MDQRRALTKKHINPDFPIPIKNSISKFEGTILLGLPFSTILFNTEHYPRQSLCKQGPLPVDFVEALARPKLGAATGLASLRVMEQNCQYMDGIRVAGVRGGNRTC